MSTELKREQEELPVDMTGLTPGVQAIVMLAQDKSIDLDRLKTVIEMQEQAEKRQAEKMYFSNMSKVQQEIPIIIKTKKNKQTNSKYAAMDDIARIANPILGTYGFSISYNTEKSENGWIKYTATVKHEGGHSEVKTIDLPPDTEGAKGGATKNTVQGIVSTTTYAQRVLMRMICNLAAGEDRDGNSVNVPHETISNEQLEELSKGLDLCPKGYVQKLYRAYNIEDLANLPSKAFDSVMKAINTFLDKEEAK